MTSSTSLPQARYKSFTAIPTNLHVIIHIHWHGLIAPFGNQAQMRISRTKHHVSFQSALISRAHCALFPSNNTWATATT
uniref:Uncharacterized protein n=1 Tax=Arundo donax TaxID=35708 RepID=A0A0A8XVT2_ARUDO